MSPMGTPHLIEILLPVWVEISVIYREYTISPRVYCLFCLNIIEDTIYNYRSLQMFKHMKNETLNSSLDQKTSNKQQLFIAEQLQLFLAFMQWNQDIITTMADKGGKLIITSRNLYNDKISRWFHKSILLLETKYFFQLINPFFNEDAAMGYNIGSYQLDFEPYVMARKYGLFKIHKEDAPIRPIVSIIDGLGSRF